MATTTSRRPLNPRSFPQLPTVVSPLAMKGRSTPLTLRKRSRSPEAAVEAHALASKRARSGPRDSPAPAPAPAAEEEAKERKRMERESQKEEFRVKYTRAFPSWIFYLDWEVSGDLEGKKRLQARLMQMGSRVEDFFSNEVTHFITNQSLPSDELGANKENVSKSRAGSSRAPSILKSPIRLKGRTPAEEVPVTAGETLVKKAMAFNMKIWTVSKLESVLDRCLPQTGTTPASSRAGLTPAPAPPGPRSLSRLLESERLHGTTERDPTQKRHDFRYFAKGSYFVLVEDMRQELATIHALEYPVARGRDGREEGAWPVLHCHPKARGPFLEYDEKEARRAKRVERQDAEREQERRRLEARVRERERRRKEEAQRAQSRHDMRRTVSMVNLKRRVSGADAALLDLDGELGSANASGYLASGTYMAASGNSVAITSTTGTTSTTGLYNRSLQLPASLRSRAQQQVVTSRRVGAAPLSAKGKEKEVGDMGPPAGIPEKKVLRKSKSTNTLKLPKREEGNKPGYCECCRVKFPDFNEHILSRKHRKFAADDSNFLQLDYVLDRVRRPTRAETAADNSRGASEAYDPLDDRTPTHSDAMVEDEPALLFAASSEEVADFLPAPVQDPDWDIDAEAVEEDIDLDPY